MTAAIENPFPALTPGSVVELPATDHFESTYHLWSQPEIHALTLAVASRRPLLVRGEAGAGKSQIARAAAHALKSGAPEVEVIHPRFEPQDLLFTFDAVQRLSDAQLRGPDGQPLLDQSNRKYVKRGALWRAFDRARQGATLPVLLIDEIDKADADVPNSLLDVLGNRSFTVPPLGGRVGTGGAGLPLTVITTNEERELPAAFVRRCVVLNLNPPPRDEAFVAWLLERVKAHGSLAGVDAEVARIAARQVLADRLAAQSAGLPKVGLAELVDLLHALAELTAALPVAERPARQRRWLEELNAYALVKHAGQNQQREMVAGPSDPA